MEGVNQQLLLAIRKEIREAIATMALADLFRRDDLTPQYKIGTRAEVIPKGTINHYIPPLNENCKRRYIVSFRFFDSRKDLTAYNNSLRAGNNPTFEHFNLAVKLKSYTRDDNGGFRLTFQEPTPAELIMLIKFIEV